MTGAEPSFGWRLLVRLATRLLPAEIREEYLGDLTEERERRGASYFRETLWAAGEVVNLFRYRLGRQSAQETLTSTVSWLDPLAQDFRLAVRSGFRSPGSAVVVAGTLAIGIGATTSLLAIVHGVLIRPLPFERPERLVRVGERSVEAAPEVIWSTSPGNFYDLDAGTGAFEGLAAYRTVSFNLSGGDLPVRLRGQRVTHDFFSLLGFPMALGRDFLPSDDAPGAEPVVILEHGLWRDRWGADERILDRTLELNGRAHQVIGVLEPGFALVGEPRMWTPFAFDEEERAERRGRFIEAIGRLRDGVSPEAGRQDLVRRFAALTEAYPDLNRGRSVGTRGLTEWVVGNNAPRRLILFSAAALLLLAIACVNVLHLGLARAAGRRGELALRSALGAGRLRLARLQVFESLVIAALGAVGGMWLAHLGTALLLDRLGPWFPRASEVRVDAVAVGWAALVTLGVSVLVGLVPVLLLRTSSPRDELSGTRSGSSGRGLRYRGALVVTEVTLALVLLVGAGLLLRSLWRLSAVDLGVDTSSAVIFTVALPSDSVPDPEEFLGFFDQVDSALATIPGVRAVGAQNRVPLQGGGNATLTRIDGAAVPSDRLVEMREVLPGLFDALGIPLLEGRVPEASDRHGPPVAVVNRTFAREFLAGPGVLGRSFAVSDEGGEFRIIGMVEDVRTFGPAEPAPPIVYFPYGAGPWGSRPYQVFVLRAEDPGAALVAARKRIAQIDPLVPVANAALLSEIARERLGGSRRAAALLFGLFAGLALLLACGGIYAVTAHAVSAARHDHGVRRAIGATPRDIHRLILGLALKRAALGAAIGSVVAALMTRSLAGLLYEIAPLEPVTFVASAGVIFGVTVLACVLPARRAGAVDPVEALR